MEVADESITFGMAKADEPMNVRNISDSFSSIEWSVPKTKAIYDC
jgi:hypothetical protein